jgi:hypothetical protein
MAATSRGDDRVGRRAIWPGGYRRAPAGT